MSGSVQRHLLDGEQVLDHIVADKWAWISTDRRLIKYRRNDSGREELSDVSYDEISGVSLTTANRNDAYLIAAAVLGLVGIYATIQEPFLIVIPACAIYPLWLWRNSGKAYFEFRGGGLLSQEPEKWRIDQQNVSQHEATEFVRSVRERI